MVCPIQDQFFHICLDLHNGIFYDKLEKGISLFHTILHMNYIRPIIYYPDFIQVSLKHISLN